MRSRSEPSQWLDQAPIPLIANEEASLRLRSEPSDSLQQPINKRTGCSRFLASMSQSEISWRGLRPALTPHPRQRDAQVAGCALNLSCTVL